MENGKRLRSWHLAVHGANENNDISDEQKEKIRYQCRYLKIALTKAKCTMGGANRPTWRQCCEYAMDLMVAVGEDYTCRAETIEEWHILLRENDDHFAHPNPLIAAGDRPEPLFFSENPRAKMAFLQYADELAGRGELHSEAMMDYTNNTLVPKALEKHNKLEDEQDITYCSSRGDFLRAFGLLKGRPVAASGSHDQEETLSVTFPVNENISQSTIIRWMNIFGYKYDTARKHFYNDTHEDPMTIADRWRFILRYLFRYEPRTHRWIRIPKVDSEIMKENKCVPEDAGYQFTRLNGEKIVEYHVDDCKSFSLSMNK